MNKENLKIDPELQSLLPPLSEGEYQQLEDNIVNNGYDKNFPIMVWKGYIADGHNRYKICKEHNITDYTVTTLAYQTKEEVMEWMLDVQLGRRNLNKAQRVLAAEKFREYYERQARENMSEGGGDQKSGLPKWTTPINKINVRITLAQKAGVGNGTYSRCKTVLDSNNEELKHQMLSGDITINAAYNMVRSAEHKEDKQVISNNPSKTVDAITFEQTNNEEVENNIAPQEDIDNNSSYKQNNISNQDVNKDKNKNKDITKSQTQDINVTDKTPNNPPYILDDQEIQATREIYEKELLQKQHNREDMKQVNQICKELKRDNTVDVFHSRLDGYIKDINFILSSIQNDKEHTSEDLNSCISYVEDFYNSIKEIIEKYK